MFSCIYPFRRYLTVRFSVSISIFFFISMSSFLYSILMIQFDWSINDLFSCFLCLTLKLSSWKYCFFSMLQIDHFSWSNEYEHTFLFLSKIFSKIHQAQVRMEIFRWLCTSWSLLMTIDICCEEQSERDHLLSPDDKCLSTGGISIKNSECAQTVLMQFLFNSWLTVSCSFVVHSNSRAESGSHEGRSRIVDSLRGQSDPTVHEEMHPLVMLTAQSLHLLSISRIVKRHVCFWFRLSLKKINLQVVLFNSFWERVQPMMDIFFHWRCLLINYRNVWS